MPQELKSRKTKLEVSPKKKIFRQNWLYTLMQGGLQTQNVGKRDWKVKQKYQAFAGNDGINTRSNK